MTEGFSSRPILNLLKRFPRRHEELDKSHRPTNRVIAAQRTLDCVTRIPKHKKCNRKPSQQEVVFDVGMGFSRAAQQYDQPPSISVARQNLEFWRWIPDPSKRWEMPDPARLLQYPQHHGFQGIRPFFCRIQAVDVAIWLTDVAPDMGKSVANILDHLTMVNEKSNPELMWLVLKLDTVDNNMTVMAVLIACRPDICRPEES